MKSLHDRVMGCIVGGAIGDYVGSPHEGRVGPFTLKMPIHSEITDDTQLTLATCEAIIQSGGPDAEAIARTFGEWFVQGRITGIGSSTLKALRDISLGAHWALSGARGEMSAGNGAAMRIAPLAFCIDPLSETGQRQIREISSITHRNDEAYAGALAIAIAVAAPDYAFASAIMSALPDGNTRDRFEALLASGEESVTSLGLRHGNSGYVAESVPIALIAAGRANSKSFLESITSVIECGGDTDTTSSMTGQIIGSKIGLSGITTEITEIPDSFSHIFECARSFADFVDEGRMVEQCHRP